MGSDLKASATVIESHGQDSAFWPMSVKGENPNFPEDGQVVSVKVKGTVLKEKGAADPANMIHFQSLLPAGSDQSRQVWLTSAAFYLPIDSPDAVTTFKPENLCVKQGGTLAFNDIGGFEWGGSLSAPLDRDHYRNGAPFQVFAAVRDSVTARFSGDAATYNGDTLTTTGANPAGKGGTINNGQELLMQYVVATGDDRSQSCGGPARHPDGTLVAPKIRQLRVAGKGTQRPYVTKDRRFNVGLYCESPDAGCTGTAQLVRRGKPLQKNASAVAVTAQSSGRIGFRLGKALFKAVEKSHSLLVDLVLTSQFGSTTTRLNLKR